MKTPIDTVRGNKPLSETLQREANTSMSELIQDEHPKAERGIIQ